MPITKPHVLLLHGLGESPLRLALIATALRCAGYSASAPQYPSTEYPAEELTPLIGDFINQHRDAPALHIVTHSMGGILARAWLQDHAVPNLGRVVMLAPGHRGSEAFNLYRHTPPFRELFGPAGQQAAKDEDCFACHLSENVDYEVGVIAGCLSLNPLAWFAMSWPNDGNVAVRDTMMRGMKDHVVVPAGHDSIPLHPLSVLQTLHFLRHGEFQHLMGWKAREIPFAA